MKSQLNLSWIPNKENFEFHGITKDGVTVKCVVGKDANGSHYILGAKFKDLTGWFNIEPNKNKL